MEPEDDKSQYNLNDPNDNTNDGGNKDGGDKKQVDLGDLFTGLGSMFAGASVLVTSIDDAANPDDPNANNNTQSNPSNRTSTNTQSSPKISPWVIGGGILVVVLLVALLMMKKNGGTNSNPSTTA